MPGDSLTDRVTAYIFNYIRENELSTGASLPSELRTSTELRISRGVVREAFSSLEIAGIIKKGNGRSPKVGELNSSFLIHLLTHAVSTKQISVMQVLELRCSIEAQSAELAARRRTRSEILRLRSTVESMREAVGRPTAFVQCDLDFHDLINRASGNPLIEVISEAMQESMQESMRVGLLKRRSKSDIYHVVESHESIAKAIEQGDAKLAGSLMKKHFQDTQVLLALMQDDGS